MYNFWSELVRKLMWPVFIALVLWFLIYIALGDWHSGLVNYYKHLGM